MCGTESQGGEGGKNEKFWQPKEKGMVFTSWLEKSSLEGNPGSGGEKTQKYYQTKNPTRTVSRGDEMVRINEKFLPH